MTLKRLTPLINQRDLGTVRLWRDELAEIVRLMRQIDGVSVVSIEADDYVVGDIEIDLPKVAPKLHRFEAIASRESQSPDGPLQLEMMLEVSFSRDKSEIKAQDPNLQTVGVIEAICSLTERCRRLPPFLAKIARSKPKRRIRRWLGLSLIFLILVGYISLWIGQPLAVIEYAIEALIIFSVGRWFVAHFIAKTILYTGTRAEAPTWWQEHRSEVGINVVCSLIFLIVAQ